VKNKQNNPVTISFESYKANKMNMLDSITIWQKNKLVQYLENIKSLAKQASNDALFQSFFRQQISFNDLDKKDLPIEIIEKTKSTESKVLAHFIDNYNQFYDLLMINRKGKIIYTIRKEEDLNQNIFKDKFSHTLLSQKLFKATNESFVDFQFYEISKEPSAFFIEPVIDNQQIIGWLVLQFSTTKINSIFHRNQNLGETGEVILVNKNQFMLTDSRFSAESTILKQKLAENNISEKFKLGQGHKTVTDYRGFKVASSFKVFKFWDSEWLIIAKMNEAEILTNYFKTNRKKLYNCIRTAIKERKITPVLPQTYSADIEVNIDEFKRIENSQSIYTKGLSTCTGLLVIKQNEFAYLAHISPYDRIYNENRTDIIGQLMQRINYLEITKAEKQLLQFIVMSPDIATAKNTINRLINEGIFLNQLKIITKKGMRSAEIYYQCGKPDALIKLNPKNDSDISIFTSTKHIPRLNEEICLNIGNSE
jgi:hypothetical protein